MTSSPSNEAELQLYRVLQRASLLNYYDVLLEMGGDDVQQLCDANEDEFLEIMALVGMAAKPLHVRRLQKALQEWVNNPSQFQRPIVPNAITTDHPWLQCQQRMINISMNPSVLPRPIPSPETRPLFSLSPGTLVGDNNSCSSNTSAPNAASMDSQPSFAKIIIPTSPAPTATVTSSSSRCLSPQNVLPPSTGSSPASSVTSPIQIPALRDIHVHKLAKAAEKVVKHMPLLEPKPQNTKKRNSKELELVIRMPALDPRRMTEIRKYSAIYGRFDCKRRPEKPLTLHEIMVNEAAAQICSREPALLARRDELFPLARQAVRRAGLNYTRHLATPPGGLCEEEDDATPSKKPRQEDEPSNGVASASPGSQSNSSLGGVRTESDEADDLSRCSHSSTSTPPLDVDESRPQVVAARGDNIIAVANPALQAAPHPTQQPRRRAA